MLYRPMVIWAALLCGSINSHAAAEDAIGTVTRMQGEASGTRGSATELLRLNTSVFLDEIVSTGEAGRLEITFSDKTQLTLGARTKLSLDTYVFDPGARSGKIKFGVTGAFRFLSGEISKLASADVNVNTPVATIGIRGTEFWGGPIDNQVLGVFLIQGTVAVSNTRGAQTLSQPGQGTNISAPDTPPGSVSFWPADKVARAIATVAFQ
jgi:hypothetical protein